MIKDILEQLRPLIIIFVALFLLTGIVYPAVIYMVGQIAFPYQADGSLIHNGSQVTGSTLIGQPFSDPKYFWSRPSYTVPYPDNPLASSGSNYGPTNKQLVSDVSNRTTYWQNATGLHEIPVDLVTGSASGLDPDLSLDAAMVQVPRIAQVRGLDNATVERLVNANIEGPLVGPPGDQIVNVVKLNMALDSIR